MNSDKAQLIIKRYLVRMLVLTVIHFWYKQFDPFYHKGVFHFELIDVFLWSYTLIVGMLIWEELNYLFKRMTKNRKSFTKPAEYMKPVLVFFFYGVIASVMIGFVLSLCYNFFFDHLIPDIPVQIDCDRTGLDRYLHFDMISGIFFFMMQVMLVNGIIIYNKNLHNMEVFSEKLQKENIISKYNALKNQTDPHFFFNSLSVLTGLVYKDPDLSADYITKLSKIYRYILETREKDFITIQEEINFIESYMFLMKIRFNSIELIVDEKIPGSRYIPPCTLQLLVENAVKHNISTDDKPLKISMFAKDEMIVISNVINKRKNIEASVGMGLDNIKKRFELLSKRISISDKDGVFRVEIPYFKNNKLEM